VKEWVPEGSIRRIAAQQALDTGQTIIPAIPGWIAVGIIMAVGSMILNLIGWTVIGRWMMGRKRAGPGRPRVTEEARNWNAG